MPRPPLFGPLTRVPTLTGSKVRLRPKRLQDAARDYSWRRDAELCRLDAAAPISCSFEKFLNTYIQELHYPGKSLRFAIETLDGKHIGNCSYFNMDETKGEGEMGIMIGDRAYWDRGYGTDAILISLNHIFSQTSLKRIYLKTLKWNARAQKCFRKCGFVPCGELIHRGHTFVIMEIQRPSKSQGHTNSSVPGLGQNA